MTNKTIEELIYYAETHLELNKYDEMFIRNTLLHELNESNPYDGKIDKQEIERLNTPTLLIERLKEDNPDISDYEVEKIMSILSPRPSEIIEKFNKIKELDGPEKACKYFFNLMIYNNYIKADYIKKNIKWEYQGENNTLEITINLSKPEKNNKDIAAARKIVETGYPKCVLCYENEGYYGGGKIQPRSNIRVIPMKFKDQDWFFQYSPYAYYNEHAIIINKIHTPMAISNRTIENEMMFVDQLPNYFVGSNSDLPIVGGSLLSHTHFQGGEHLMPMMFAKDRYQLLKKSEPECEISYLEWYNSAILIKSKNKESLLRVTNEIIEKYWNYSDESIDLIANDNEGRHNTITTITRKVDNTYHVFIIFRNNRCNEEYPDGIFHAHKEYHNIKSEGIGLIEAMGLFILPGRLQNELSLIKEILTSNDISVTEFLKDHPELQKHINFINELIVKYNRNNPSDYADKIIKDEVGRVCENVLKNTGVFKNTIDGQLALMKFFKELGLEAK